MLFKLSNFIGIDDIERFGNAFSALSENPGSTLIVEPGEYSITTPLARETQRKVMAGEYGANPEKVMFMPGFNYDSGLSMRGLKDITVLAKGARLIVDGFMEPVEIRNCEGVTLEGLIIDHKRKPYSKGFVTAVNINENTITVSFPEEYPLCADSPMPRAVFFDLERNRLFDYGNYKVKSHRELSPQVFEFTLSCVKEDYLGCELYVWHSFHSRPAILIENSKDITFRQVTIHSQPGMGIVAHRNENLYFYGLRVVPSAGEHLSTNTDATHITSCKGELIYESCVFEGQGDDALNVHTYYHTIAAHDNNNCTLRLDSPTGTHSSSADCPDAGDILELTDNASLEAVDRYTVLSSKSLSPFESALVLNKPLPADCSGYSFADATRCPSLTYRNNYSRSHLARGILIKTKNALIENNCFVDVVGTAVYVAAEGWWKEGVCTTESIVIRNNRIITCGRTNDIRQCDTAGICVTVDSESPIAATHKNVLIEYNTVDCPHSPHAIYTSNIQKLEMHCNDCRCADTPIISK